MRGREQLTDRIPMSGDRIRLTEGKYENQVVRFRYVRGDRFYINVDGRDTWTKRQSYYPVEAPQPPVIEPPRIAVPQLQAHHQRPPAQMQPQPRPQPQPQPQVQPRQQIVSGTPRTDEWIRLTQGKYADKVVKFRSASGDRFWIDVDGQKTWTKKQSYYPEEAPGQQPHRIAEPQVRAYLPAPQGHLQPQPQQQPLGPQQPQPQPQPPPQVPLQARPQPHAPQQPRPQPQPLLPLQPPQPLVQLPQPLIVGGTPRTDEWIRLTRGVHADKVVKFRSASGDRFWIDVDGQKTWTKKQPYYANANPVAQQAHAPRDEERKVMAPAPPPPVPAPSPQPAQAPLPPSLYYQVRGGTYEGQIVRLLGSTRSTYRVQLSNGDTKNIRSPITPYTPPNLGVVDEQDRVQYDAERSRLLRVAESKAPITLIVGDGDLTFSLAHAKLFPEEIVVATTYDSEEEAKQKYGIQVAADILREAGHLVLRGVDARHLDRQFGGNGGVKFHQIIWNFPHDGTLQGIRLGELVDAYLRTAPLVLEQTGRVRLTILDSPWYRARFRISRHRNLDRLVLDAEGWFDDDGRYAAAGYVHRKTNNARAAPNERAMVYTFRLQ